MRCTAILLLLVSSPVLRADDPPKHEVAPPPRGVIVLPAPNLLLPPAYAHGTHAVWQNHAVDATGRWRPRVILAPFGSYYYYNGRDYPWAETHGRSFRPVTHD